LRQTIGLAKADRVATLQIDWPTSGTTQVFRDIPINRSIEITELEQNYKTLKTVAISLPE
jgi:ASPIC and UnbV